MLRRTIPFLLVLAFSLTAFAANTTVVVNGKTLTVPYIVQGGKAYVDIAALAKLLGGSASYSADAKKVVATLPGVTLATIPAKSNTASAGMVQLPGDNGELGKVYSMQKSNPIYFSLKSAEYTTGRITIGNVIYAPDAGEKMLVLHFTVQNPQKSDLFVRYDSLKCMAVDAMNVNHEYIQDWGDEESHNGVSLNLKPAQTLAVYTAIKVPAKGAVPKLMISPTDDSPVLRYDLREKVTPLAAPFADPTDTAGLTALETVPVKLGTAYPFHNFDLTVEKFEYVTTTLGDYSLEEGERFLVATVLAKNQTPAEVFLRYDSVTPVLTTTDGQECAYKDMFFATTNTPVAQNAKPGQAMRVRMIFVVGKDAKGDKLSIREGESRTYEYTVPQ